MLFRSCLSIPVRIEASRKENGRYELSGQGASEVAFYYDIIETVTRDYLNISEIYSTPILGECIERITNNITDIAWSYIDYKDEYKNVLVPVPFFPRQIALTTGYNWTHYTSSDRFIKESITENITLPIWLIIGTVIFWILLFLIISCKANFRSKKQIKLRKYPKMFMEKLNKTKLLLFCSIIWNMFTVIIFFAQYQTDNIAVVKPETIGSYDEVFNNESIKPIFFNALFNDAKAYAAAKKNTPRGQLWSRIPEDEDEKEKYVFEGNELNSDFIRRVRGAAELLVNRDAVFIGTEQVSLMVKRFACSLTEENEYLKFITIREKTEIEELLGFGVITGHVMYPFIKRKLHLYHQSHIVGNFLHRIDTSVAFMMTGASPRHKVKQTQICSDDSVLDSSTGMFTPDYTYYVKFMEMCLMSISAAFGILIVEKYFIAKKIQHHRLNRSCRPRLLKNK